MVAGKPYETVANYTRSRSESELETHTQGEPAHPDPAALDEVGVRGVVGGRVPDYGEVSIGVPGKGRAAALLQLAVGAELIRSLHTERRRPGHGALRPDVVDVAVIRDLPPGTDGVAVPPRGRADVDTVDQVAIQPAIAVRVLGVEQMIVGAVGNAVGPRRSGGVVDIVRTQHPQGFVDVTRTRGELVEPPLVLAEVVSDGG